jgi:bacterioferritin-associated ferredoxin
MRYKITKCICYDTTFEEMKKIMKENNLTTLDELREFKTVALNCKLCVPYITRMINTGQTNFELTIEQEI